MSKYARTLEELKSKAVLFWPQDVLENESSVSVLPLLLKTQDKFLSVLNLSDAGPESWKNLLSLVEEMPGNLFLKHLMVLTDLGGEALNKMTPLGNFYKDGVMNYVWREKKHTYQFKATIAKNPLTNSALRVSGKSLLKGYDLDAKMLDVTMILLHGPLHLAMLSLPILKKNAWLARLWVNRNNSKNLSRKTISVLAGSLAARLPMH